VKLNPLLVLASLVYGAVGLALTFAPNEMLAWTGVAPSFIVAWLGQLLGAALLGLAFLNWLQRHAVVGGIFGRPILLTNLTFLIVAFFASVRQLRAHHEPLFAAVSVLLGILSVAFGLRLFSTPSSPSTKAHRDSA
jgi:hypothetical protein